jgi:hypothetical protein
MTETTEQREDRQEREQEQAVAAARTDLATAVQAEVERWRRINAGEMAEGDAADDNYCNEHGSTYDAGRCEFRVACSAAEVKADRIYDELSHIVTSCDVCPAADESDWPGSGGRCNMRDMIDNS